MAQAHAHKRLSTPVCVQTQRRSLRPRSHEQKLTALENFKSLQQESLSSTRAVFDDADIVDLRDMLVAAVAARGTVSWREIERCQARAATAAAAQIALQRTSLADTLAEHEVQVAALRSEHDSKVSKGQAATQQLHRMLMQTSAVLLQSSLPGSKTSCMLLKLRTSVPAQHISSMAAALQQTSSKWTCCSCASTRQSCAITCMGKTVPMCRST